MSNQHTCLAIIPRNIDRCLQDFKLENHPQPILLWWPPFYFNNEMPQSMLGITKTMRHAASQFTLGGMPLQHIPGTRTRSIFMCVQILWFCKYYMSRIHFPAKCSCYTSLLHVPATRPCHMSPQRVLHTFLSMPHVAATWPLVSGYLYSLKQSSLSSVVCSICDLLK